MTTHYLLKMDGIEEGPFTKDELIEFGLDGDTLVWAYGWPDWVPAWDVPEFADLFPMRVPPESFLREPYFGLRFAFNSSLVSIVVYILLLCLGGANIDEFLPMRLLAALPSLLGLLGWGLFLWFLYRAWVVMQDGEARTTPARAVGFLLIPVFHWYWIFVATRGLAKGLGDYGARHRLRAPRPSFLLGTAVSVFFVVSAVPILGAGAFLLNLILIPFFADSIYRTARCYCRENRVIDEDAARVRPGLQRVSDPGLAAVLLAPLGVFACLSSLPFTPVPYVVILQWRGFDAVEPAGVNRNDPPRDPNLQQRKEIRKLKESWGIVLRDEHEVFLAATLAVTGAFLLLLAWTCRGPDASKESPASETNDSSP